MLVIVGQLHALPKATIRCAHANHTPRTGTRRVATVRAAAWDRPAALEDLVTYPVDDVQQCGVPMPDGSFTVRETGCGRGLGLFATVPIEANTFLFDYSGLTLPREAYRRDHACQSDYIAMIDNIAGFTFIIDAKDPAISSLGRYMNHADMSVSSFDAGTDSCNTILLSQNPDLYHANMVQLCHFFPAACERQELLPPPRLHVFTVRAIETGEELCWDYGDDYWKTMGKRGKVKL